MPRELNLFDGASTLAFHSGNARVIDYTPATPTREVRTITDESDGGKVSNLFWRNVSETAVMQFTSQSQMRSAMTAVLLMSERSRQRQKNQAGGAVYAQFRPDTAEALYRSEVLDLKVAFSDRLWRRLAVSWTRRHYWEGAEALLSLVNNVSGANGIQTIYNHSRDASNRNNFVRILAGGVGGDLPTPIRIQLTNTFASGTNHSDIYIGHKIEDNGQLVHIIEAESGTLPGMATAAANSSASGGSHVNFAWTGATEVSAWSATLTSAMLAASNSKRVRLLGYSINGASSGIYGKLQIRIEGITQLWESPQWVKMSENAIGGGIVDFGSLDLPSTAMGGGTPYPLTLHLILKGQSGSNTANLDYIHIMPADGFRRLRNAGFGLAQNATIYDDGMTEELYTSGWATAGKLMNYTGQGKPIMLVPYATNALYFLVDPASTVLRSSTVQVYYRPRRLLV